MNTALKTNDSQFNIMNKVIHWETESEFVFDYLSHLNNNLAFIGLSWSGHKQILRKYIRHLSATGKVIIIDSEGSADTYNRFKNSKYSSRFEQKYHMKMDAGDFFNIPNVIEEMRHRGVNILKIKSIQGIMSAGELYTVIMKKINEDNKQYNEQVHIVLNKYTIDALSSEEFFQTYCEMPLEKFKFIYLHDNIVKMPKSITFSVNSYLFFKHNDYDAYQALKILNLNKSSISRLMNLDVKQSILI